MTIKTFDSARMKSLALLFGLLFVFAQIFSVQSNAQARRKTTVPTAKKKPVAKRQQSAGNNANNKTPSSLVKVTRIDEIALKDLLKRGENAKPLLVNFWATWCDPCREEFPELVKINAEYAGKIDFVTVSLDDLAEIKRDVPKFLAEMKATMPAYLLKTEDEEAAIAVISKDYVGGLPFTILFNPRGETVYFRQGKVEPKILRAQIDKAAASQTGIVLDKDTEIKIKLLREAEKSENPFQSGKAEAQKDVISGRLQIIEYGEGRADKAKSREILKNKYGVETLELGCKMTTKLIEFIKGYNEISMTEIKQKFGNSALGVFVQN